MTTTGSSNSSERKATASPLTLRIMLRGAHIVSFKNTKMIARGRLITDPKKQKHMEAYTRHFESQLRSAYQTAVAGMPTAPSLQSWIASCMPRDDSVRWITDERVTVERVEKGEEGADIIIERLT